MDTIKITFDKIDKPHWIIKSEPQENGLWGTPFNCKSIDKLIFNSDENLKKQSAILIALAETFPYKTFSVQLSSEVGFALYFKGNPSGPSPCHYYFKYDDYILMKNILIYNK